MNDVAFMDQVVYTVWKHTFIFFSRSDTFFYCNKTTIYLILGGLVVGIYLATSGINKYPLPATSALVNSCSLLSIAF